MQEHRAVVVTKPPGEEGEESRGGGGGGGGKGAGATRKDEARQDAGRREGRSRGAGRGRTRKRHRRRGGRDEDEASRTEQQSATRQASAIPGEHERVVAERAPDEGRVPPFHPGKREKEGERSEGRKERSEEGWGRKGVAGRPWIPALRVDSRKRKKRTANEGKQQVGWLPLGKGGS